MRVLGAAVLDVEQGLAEPAGDVPDRSPSPSPARGSGVTASPPSQTSRPTGVTTAAVPQAKTSLISPLATPSRHSSMAIRRSSTA